MASFKIGIYDSNHNFLEEISVDNAVIKPDILTTQYHHGKSRTTKMRKYSDKLVRKILESHSHFTEKFVVVRHQYKRRDGILIEIPFKIKLITEVPDDRNLLGEVANQTDQIYHIFSKIFGA